MSYALSPSSRSTIFTTIRDNTVMLSEAFEHMVKKELSNSICVNRFRARNQDYPLCKAMVYHDHEGVITVRKGKVGDEVDRELFEGKQRGRFDE